MANSKIGNEGVTFANLSTAPASPVAGQVYFNTSEGFLMIWDGDVWHPVSESRDFLHRQIITHGSVMGGYVSTSPWRNVNTMNHSTDVMTNNGDVLPSAAAYTSGACSLTNGYLWSADNTWPGTSTTTAAFNMFTYTGFSGAQYNMRVGRNDMATVFKEHEMAWITGGGSADVDVFNLSTETMYTTDQGVDTTISGDSMQSGHASFSDETKGYIWQESNTGNRISFGTGTAITVATSGVGGIGSQQKGISSKVGFGYAGNEGTYLGGYNLRRWNLGTETNIGNVAKPVGNCGEENFDMGQDHQYMMGCYDGAQNNRGWKFSYTTSSGYELGAGSVRTGPSGGSSGHCVWRG